MRSATASGDAPPKVALRSARCTDEGFVGAESDDHVVREKIRRYVETKARAHVLELLAEDLLERLDSGPEAIKLREALAGSRAGERRGR
jgi:hypothetical protein